MSEKKEKDIEFNKEDAVSASDEQIIRLSRNTSEYVYATSKGKELSINVAKTMNLLDAQPDPSDDDFFDVCITEDSLAKIIKARQKNLHQEITKGDFLDELRTSAFISQKKNEKGEIVYAEILNAISYVKYEDGKLYIRKNPDMKRFSLNLGKNNPYYEIFTQSTNALAKHKQIELYKLIENELSRFEYELGMKTKMQMLKDHKWRELHISIFKIRQSTFTLETYKENHNFISILLKRQLKTVSEKTDIEIKYDEITTNKKGEEAEYVIMSVRRKEDLHNLFLEDNNEEIVYFEDDELNKKFIEFLNFEKIEEHRRDFFKARLIQCVNDSMATSGDNINIDIALRIINMSLRRGWKDFFPLKKEDIDLIISNEQRRENKKKYKELEMYYLNQNGDF